MRCLVTGASGFVGAWLVRDLAEAGHAVIAQMRARPSALFGRLGLADHPRVRVLENAAIPEIVGAEAPDELYHLAGMSQIVEAMEAPARVFEANARLTWQMLDALRRMDAPPRCVIASSDSIYGETGGRAACEEDPARALGPYEISKAMADMAARTHAALFGLPIVVARLGNVYGPGDPNTARLIPSIIGAICRGGVPHLRGGGKAVRSLLHVRDCTAALRLLAANAGREGIGGEAFNVSGAPAMSTLEIARLALAAFGKGDLEPEISAGAPGETSVKVSSAEKIGRVLGWRPERSLEAGLSEIRAWMEAG